MKDSIFMGGKKLSKHEIEEIFREMKLGNKFFSPEPIIKPNYKDPTEEWIIASGSSKQNNKLIEVSTWQIGQAY